MPESFSDHVLKKAAERLLTNPQALEPLASKLALAIVREFAARPTVYEPLMRRFAQILLEEAARQKTERNGQTEIRWMDAGDTNAANLPYP